MGAWDLGEISVKSMSLGSSNEKWIINLKKKLVWTKRKREYNSNYNRISERKLEISKEKQLHDSLILFTISPKPIQGGFILGLFFFWKASYKWKSNSHYNSIIPFFSRQCVGVVIWPVRPEFGPIVAGLDCSIIKWAELGLMVFGQIGLTGLDCLHICIHFLTIF